MSIKHAQRSKRLSLKKVAIRPLTPLDLEDVVGGLPNTIVAPQCPTVSNPMCSPANSGDGGYGGNNGGNGDGGYGGGGGGYGGGGYGGGGYGDMGGY
jgi:hypothetical protein